MMNAKAQRGKKNMLRRARNHIPALTVAFILTLVGASWVVPPQYNTFVVQRYLQELWMFLLGILNLLYWLLITDNSFLAVISLPVLAGLFGMAAQVFLSAGCLGRIVILSLVVGNSILGIYFLAFGVGDGVLDNIEEEVACQHFTSADEGIRIVHYTQNLADFAFAHYFFLETDDGGENWNQIGHTGYEFGISYCDRRMSSGNIDFNYVSCEPETNARPSFSPCYLPSASE